MRRHKKKIHAVKHFIFTRLNFLENGGLLKHLIFANLGWIAWVQKVGPVPALLAMPIKIHPTIRWAHFNVKLHFFSTPVLPCRHFLFRIGSPERKSERMGTYGYERITTNPEWVKEKKSGQNVWSDWFRIRSDLNESHWFRIGSGIVPCLQGYARWAHMHRFLSVRLVSLDKYSRLAK